MEWRVIGQNIEWADGRGRFGPAVLEHLKPTQRIRITVEEEVNECCEKWRGMTEGSDFCRDGSRWLPIRVYASPLAITKLHGPVRFCPECGRKL
jgi:hypothetical protein